MGQELECRVRVQKRTLTGRAYLEGDHILFRGQERLKVMLKDVTGVSAAEGVLTLEFPGGPAAFELGAAAEKWRHKILHPPSRLDKLGVKEGMAIRLVGALDDDFLAELPAVSRKGKADLIFVAASTNADLKKLARCVPELRPAGALWVIYPKGVQSIREIEVLQAGRAAGLKDVKVASFSATHTGLKFVIPVAKR